ncbi:MAG: ABC transporter substrate-binding protein [Proteobacteria bacterium]|nr:ABC transporter substrate-binding protein [Pseudomonadota bacterium]NOG61397.1 ABC transporter substrate-binding protein [Pseudomonadota bacterium]
MEARVFKSLFLFLYLITGSSQLVIAAQSPDAVVKQTSDGVINRIESQRSTLEANPEQVYELVNELVIPHFDFISMSKWVLGKNWKNASEAQRTEFIEQFKTLLVRTYARALLEYSGQEVKYYPVEQKPDSNLAVVKTELTSAGAQPFPVAYRMHQANEQWKVVDVAVDGVSLVSTYRGSFASQIKKEGFDSLIQKLVDKNEKLAKNLTK